MLMVNPTILSGTPEGFADPTRKPIDFEYRECLTFLGLELSCLRNGSHCPLTDLPSCRYQLGKACKTL